MRKSTRLLFAALTAATIAQAAESPPVPLARLPPVWGFMGNGGPLALPGSCEIGTDTEKSVEGQQLFSVRCTNTVVPSFGGARNDLDTAQYRGKRLRISALLMAAGIEDVSTPQYAQVTGEAGLWIGLGSASKGMRTDRMQDRTLKGTTGWVQRDFVVDVPADNNHTMLGFWMQGKGQVWMRDIKLEEVPDTVPVTPFLSDVGPDMSLAVRSVPRAEDRFLSPPEKWVAMGGQGYELCDVGVDAQLLKAGQRNLSIACSIASSPLMRQSFAAAPYWGKRVRFSGWLRTENVEPLAEAGGQGGAGLFISASGTQSAVLNTTITGTTAWQYRELVLDVPRNSQWIPLGMTLIGRGQVWGRDFKFEEVPGATPVTQSAPLRQR